jgi:hypothetical protein
MRTNRDMRNDRGNRHTTIRWIHFLLLAVLLGSFIHLHLFCGCLSASDIDRSAKRAKKVVLRGVLKGDITGRAIFMVKTPISKSTVVKGWTGKRDETFTMPFDEGWFFFIDDMAEANWTHPCRYVFVDFDGKQKIIIRASMPPRIFERIVSPDGAVTERRIFSEEIEESIKQRRDEKGERSGEGGGGSPQQEDTSILPGSPLGAAGTRHALLISGGWDSQNNHPRYLRDLKHYYVTLLGYGYGVNDITVLYANGGNIDLNCDWINDIDGDAKKTTIINTIGNLTSGLDHLSVFVTDHGTTDSLPPFGAQSGNSYIICWDDGDNNPELFGDDGLSDFELAVVIAARSPHCVTYILEQCFSGGFIDNLPITADTVVVSTACRGDEYSKAMSDLLFDEFTYHYTNALRKARPFNASDTGICRDGTAVNADANGNGKVSLKEAHTYAKANDSRAETPQYYEKPICAGNLAWAECCHGAGSFVWPPAILQDSLTLVSRGQSQAYVPFSICNTNDCSPPQTFGYRITSKGHVGAPVDLTGTIAASSGECKNVYAIMNGSSASTCDWDTLTIIAWLAGGEVLYDTCVQIIHIVEPEPVPVLTAPLTSILILAIILAAIVFMRRRAMS